MSAESSPNHADEKSVDSSFSTMSETNEKNAAQLKQCFNQLRKHRDATEQKYRLLQKAHEWDIPAETFESMFQNYCQEHSWSGRSVKWWKRLPEFAGSVSIILGLILFILEADSRKQQANDQSWAIVIAAQQAQSRANGGSASHLGRIAALEALNQGCREKKQPRSEVGYKIIFCRGIGDFGSLNAPP